MRKTLIAALASLAVLGYAHGNESDTLAEVRAELAAHLPSSYVFDLTPEFIQSVADPATQALLWAYYASNLLEAYEASEDPALLEAYRAAIAHAQALSEVITDPGVVEVLADALDELRDEAPVEAEEAEEIEEEHERSHEAVEEEHEHNPGPGGGEVEEENEHAEETEDAAEVEEDDHGRNRGPSSGEVEDEDDHGTNAGDDNHDEEEDSSDDE
ncbi:hypothetical protein [Marinithermus hydrothermalis]|nr:hypothetical protein [Marinithermus hydrothermalis]